MPAAESSVNGGAPSARDGKRTATIEGLTVAVGRLRSGVAALKAENRGLRAELAGLEREASGRRGDAPRGELTRLAEIAIPTGSRAPGAARMVVDHCLSGLVTQRILHDAELLVSELVTNSIDHGELGDGDSVLVSVYLATDTLRLEIENRGTAGVVASSPRHDQPRRGGFGLKLVDLLAARWGVSRDRSTNVWFEMTRA